MQDYRSNFFIIYSRLASLNDYILACRSNKYYGAKFKQEQEEIVTWAIKTAVRNGALKPVDYPVDVCIEWNEANKKRDADNVISSTKFVLDALVKNGILPNDNRKWVRQVYSKIVNSTRDCVVVELKRATP